jgi:hypothetical protein
MLEEVGEYADALKYLSQVRNTNTVVIQSRLAALHARVDPKKK